MTAPAQQHVTFEEVNQQIWQHLLERDWHNNHPRDLAISLSLEASELLEHYQWGDTPVGGKAAVAEELADVFIYAFEIAQVNGIDLVDVIRAKLDKAAKKYPAKDFKNKSKEEQSAAWVQRKVRHQKEGL